MSAEHELTEARCALTEVCKLLRLALCPDTDCDEGIVHRNGEWHQCQWCDERKQLLEEHG